MKIRKNDNVMVMKGKDKGKTGLVLRTFAKKNMAIVEGINLHKKHRKGETKGKGEMVEITVPIDVSKLMLVDAKTGKPTRVGYKMVDGKKVRYAKKSGEVLVNNIAKETEVKQDAKEEKKLPKKRSTKKESKKES
jgi:large subunit ribosomal protein L24